MASPRSYPVAPRVVAGALALLVAFFFGVSAPAGLVATGYPLTAYVMLGTTIPLVAFLGLVSFAPEALEPATRRWTRVDMRDAGHVAALIVMAGTLYFVLGYGSITNGVYAYEHEIVRAEAPVPLEGGAVLSGVLLNVIVLVLPPLFYVAFTGGGGPRRALENLGLHTRGATRAILVGFAWAFVALVAIAIVSYAIQGLQVEVPENERALEIAKSVTVVGAFGLAIGAAVSEEVFFRGFLQPRVGLLGQAILFSLAHLSYLNVVEFVVVFVLALIFGVIYRQTGNLLAPIAGHFLFNLLMLLIGIYS